MHIRALTEDDLAAAPDWWADRTLAADRWRGEETRSAVMEHAGEVVAAGAMWTSRVHDTHAWLEIVVHPDHRRRGIGRALARHLSSLRVRDIPMMARGYVDDPGLRFADALGATTMQIVPPARVDLARRTALRSHVRVQPLSGVPRERVEAAYAALYRWTHETWSPTRVDFADALNEDLWDEVDVDASAVAVDDRGGLLALALTYLDSEPPLIVSETTARDVPEGERLVEGCIRRAMDVLARRGLSTVDFDGHVSDPHFLPALARLEPSGRWFRLVEIPGL
ncbi:GNAT family N-acetyltransferase [uncultured Microbacterium sp.]|uniref:GNAT family N-acetyltransferase n=1 Tax=uncultured Microbacterium sp. TaxID=191216 RepID=UPI0025FEB79C|nr:GNAT family N-acetyltransferase [uncultured Microbacterium sp.]